MKCSRIIHSKKILLLYQRNGESKWDMKTPSNAKVGEYLTIFIVFSSLYEIAECIDCYKCVSLNWQNQACDDPFHTNYTSGILESPCMGGRKGRNGLFPATACIKLTGKYDDNGDHVTVRGCALDSGTLTTDTEIIRMSHCGGFFFDDRYVRGCLQSCDDADGCNVARNSKRIDHSLLIIITSGWYSLIKYFLAN